MRVMVIIKANEDSEAGVMPSEKLLTEMGKFAEIEIRPIFETEDFGAELTPELREQEDHVRAKAAELKDPTKSASIRG